MLEGTLNSLVTMLAFVGGAALISRLTRSTARLALRAAEATTSAGLAEISARRGDLTGMMERRETVRTARRQRQQALLLTIVWLAWLAVPIFAGWTREAFAVASILWLAPRRPILERKTTLDERV